MKKINWKHYYKEVEKLDEEYRNKKSDFLTTQETLDLEYLKKRVDLLQIETYSVFSTDISYYISLLQTTLTDGLVFTFVEALSPEFITEDVIERGKFTISDLKNLIKELQALSMRCYKLSESRKIMINELTHHIFNQCTYWIRELFLRENTNLPLEEMQQLEDTCHFYSCIKHYCSDYIQENYSLHAIELFKSYHTKWSINDIILKELKSRNAKGLNSLIDTNLMGGISDDLHVNFGEPDKNDWEYYQFALEYLRTILVQTVSEGFIDDEEFMERIMDKITDAIIFCMIKGKNTAIDYLDNVDAAPLCREQDYDTNEPIISQYFYDNLEYILNSFKASETFTHNEKNNMTDDIRSIYEVMPIYNI